ncbi:Dopey, N-terminal-domain-containing protein [Epithele typhae]|uniref:Dopey, N-terminal-domain-containing protein n=1 Tax=Epithele typhae TaxID=378194 RepID=UPI002007549D|nr:Dopey, N-terminal-domain-containing protein [Epithele typhae]KAH9920216.1 Dopey, N-terminal-domain-containing protein [Epithele typhae]
MSEDDAPLDGVPLPVYPLPSKPFPVQPPPKIATGFAPVIPLDKSGKPVRRWRQVNREVRGVAGGRWFVKSYVGEKESEYAAAMAAQQAAMASVAGDSLSGLALPRLSAVSISGTGRGRGRGARHNVDHSSTVASSRAGSAMPDSISAQFKKPSTPPGYAADPKFKKYTQQVEKCLSSFDSVHEWADFISFLKQLLKTLQSYQQFKEIPRKLVVSKRLSQCLNPALPNGVHHAHWTCTRTSLLSSGCVWSSNSTFTPLIQSSFQSEGLLRDLALWSSGLFPFFEYASTAVKPTVLNLFDTHYLPLQAALRPVMKSFILALLPGLEEETGEYFEKVLALLDRLAGTISQSFFFQNIWLVMLTTPRARGTALSYLSRRLPPFKPDEDITPIVGSDLGLMIRAFSAALEDDDLLVRRGALDILLQSLRIDGVAVIKSQPDDRAILMRAATSVVLRRDLALNRRLFSWLLGPAESSQAQMEYYKQYSLDLLRSTLRNEMFNPSPEYSQSRPFKIFISLLDKWEIGLPLTEVLVYDAFKALRKALGSGADSGDDNALWNRLLHAILLDFDGSQGRSQLTDNRQGCGMVKYILTTFHTHDEEIETITCRIAPSTSSQSNTPFVAAFEDIVTLTTVSSAALLRQVDRNDRLPQQVLQSSLFLLEELVGRLDAESEVPLVVSWDPAMWLSTNSQFQIATFVIVDRLVATAVKLHQTDRLEPVFSLNKRAYIQTMVDVLLYYLRPSFTAYHVRAVGLICTITGRLQDACEAFGVLWRLTEDSALPGVHLKVPMMSVLETLRSEDPKLRRIGETWVRCSLKSYLRVLDPILCDLFDPNVQYSPSSTEINGKQLQGFAYDRPFDQHYVNYLLETLLSVIKFGGQGFSKIARSTPIARSMYANLMQRLQHVTSAFPDTTYMDIMSQLLMRILQSEPKASLSPTMHAFNIVAQNLSAEILQALVARGEVDLITLESLESAVVQKLYFCVHSGRLDLQNKLLHLLHSIIVASIAARQGSSPQVDRSVFKKGISCRSSAVVQTLVDGISLPSNRSLLQHWLDFVMMTVPQFKEMLQVVVSPLTECICRQLRLALTEILDASVDGPRDSDIVSYTTDADFMMLLTVLERLSLLSMTRTGTEQVQDEDQQAAEKGLQESSGLLGYVSNVFSSEGGGSTEDTLIVKSSDYRCLHNAVRVLFAMWDKLVVPSDNHWASREESLSLIYSRARNRSRRVLEHLFRAYSTEVLEAVIDCWWEQVTARPDNVETSTAYDLVDTLTASAQNAVHMLCESISCRIPGLSERTKKAVAFAELHDMTLFDFLEQYLKRLEGPLALQVWNRFLQLAKDLLGSLRDFRPQAFAALKCFTVLADKVSQTTALDDRRIRKDMQETYGKLLDLCVLSGRSPESGSWIRRSQREALSTNGRDSPTPTLRVAEKMEEKNTSSVSLPLPDAGKATYGSDVSQQVNSYIASDALPNMRKLLIDSDKVLAACNQIVYNIVTPALKGKARPLDIEDDIIAIIREMTKINIAVKAWRPPVFDSLSDNRCFNSTADAGQAWMPMMKSFFDTDKTALPELLGKITTVSSANIFTNREYEMLLRSLNLRRLSYVILSAEKNHFLAQLPAIQEKLVDTLRNVSAPIVQSEVFLCVRVLLCRLSPHNLSSFWPVILAELYRIYDQIMQSIPGDGSEELSVILSACKLLDLLLVLQTEEFQVHQWIFITDTVDAVHRPEAWFPEALLDRLAEVVGALPVSEVRAHPLPAICLPPNALDSQGGSSASGTHLPTPAGLHTHMRCPLLASVRQIDSVRDLVPFFSSASIASYESVYYSSGVIDWPAVERGLLDDLFDGR